MGKDKHKMIASFEDALFSKNFTIPDKKYYLADAGYYNTDNLLCPYCGVCYHFKEVALAGKKTYNSKIVIQSLSF